MIKAITTRIKLTFMLVMLAVIAVFAPEFVAESLLRINGKIK